VAFRAASSNSGTATAISTAVPAGVAADDIVLMPVTNDDTSLTSTYPTGFTSLGSSNITFDGEKAQLAWKRPTGADTGSYTTTPTTGAGNTWAAGAVALSGRDTTNPPVASTVAINNTGVSNGGSVTANGVTAVAGDDLVFVAVADPDLNGVITGWTAPAGYTAKVAIEPNWEGILVATKENVSAGATGSVSATIALSGTHKAGYAAWLVRVPAAAGGGTTFTQTVSASCASSAVAARQAQLVRAATAASSAVVVRQARRALSAASAASAVVVRQPSRILTAAAACTATVATLKARFLELDASAASTAARVVQAQRIMSGSSAASGVVVRRPQRTLAASSASTATTATLKVLLLTVSASAACSAVVSRVASHVLSLAATSAATAVLARSVRRTMLTTVGDSASIVAVGPGSGTTTTAGQRPTLGVG
jgi:hypothetical protein